MSAGNARLVASGSSTAAARAGTAQTNAEIGLRARSMKIDVVRREYRSRDLKWDDRQLRLNSGRLLATVEAKWPKMFRVRLASGYLTDMVNISRARDAAVCLALAELNHAVREAQPR
jgi:hypothetical protein